MKRNNIWMGWALLIISLILPSAVFAKKHSFSIDSQREVFVTRSTIAGSKMVRVVAYGKSPDAAIEQALVDAVAALTFDGVKGEGEMEGCPAILLNGRKVYDKDKSFFDKFFRKGEFLKYVEKVNSTYPYGADNVKTSRGRRIQIILIVNWKGLADFFREAGYRTAISELSNY